MLCTNRLFNECFAVFDQISGVSFIHLMVTIRPSATQQCCYKFSIMSNFCFSKPIISESCSVNCSMIMLRYLVCFFRNGVNLWFCYCQELFIFMCNLSSIHDSQIYKLLRSDDSKQYQPLCFIITSRFTIFFLHKSQKW